MSVSLPADFDLKERVRAAVDLVDVVGTQLELRRQGRGYVARCPWHDDRRPSLMVNPERQTWRCWVCDIGGDVFSFVMQRDGVDFPEAVRILAERAGISLETASGRKSGSGKGGVDKATLLAVTKWAAEQFTAHLERSPEAQAARDYLAARAINAESCQRFHLGFAPDQWQWLLDRGAAAGFSKELLEAAGLAVPRSSGEGHYDRFRGRLIFPIYDLQDRPIAFGGRVLPGGDDRGAKYINSPETRLFSKSNQLYGLNLARDAVVRSREVMVMEGYTDVIAARQAGVEPVVAVLGTALGEGHLRILRRFADRVVLVLDGDAAGQRRADEVLELFVAANVDLRVMTLPENQDPADFIAREGREAFEQLAAEAPDAIDHKLTRLTAGIDLTNDTHRAATAMEAMLGLLARAPVAEGDLRLQQLLMRLGRIFGIAPDDLRRRLGQLRSKQRSAAGQRRSVAVLPPRRGGEPSRGGANSEPARRRPAAGRNDAASAFAEAAAEAEADAGGAADPFADPFQDPIAEPASSARLGSDNAAWPNSAPPAAPPDPPAPLEPLRGADRELFEALVEDPDLVPQALEVIDPRWFSSQTARQLLEIYQNLEMAGQSLDVMSVMLAAEEAFLHGQLAAMDERVQLKAAQATQTAAERFAAIVQRYRAAEWSVTATRQVAELSSQRLAEDEQLEVLKGLFDTERVRQGIAGRGGASTSPGEEN